MKLFVTGATGFTGSRLIPLLLANGYPVRCLYRPSSDRRPVPLAQPEIEWTTGDVSHTDAISAAVQGADALINLVSLGFGHANSMIRAAQNAAIKRSIFISTTAIFTQLDAKSKDGNSWQQPIYVDDVARAILSCLNSQKTICQSYNIAGEHPLTYNQVIDTIAAQMQKRIWKLHIPYLPVMAVMKFLERLGVTFPIIAEQVLRLNENKNFDYTTAASDIGFTPLQFEKAIKLELGTS